MQQCVHVVVMPDSRAYVCFCRTYGKQLSREEAKTAQIAVCEACKQPFKIETGYYEPEIEPTYAYCGECCHW